MRAGLRQLSRGWRHLYGARPLHLLMVLACFALTAYAAAELSSEPLLTRMIIWFAGAIVAHDLVLFPLYASADRFLGAAVHSWQRTTARRLVSPLNYVRVPALASGLLLLLFLPGIIEQGAPTYLAATGQNQSPFLGRWLLLTGGLFMTSALAYAVRVGCAYRNAKRQEGAAAFRESGEGK